MRSSSLSLTDDRPPADPPPLHTRLGDRPPRHVEAQVKARPLRLGEFDAIRQAPARLEGSRVIWRPP